MRATIRIDGPRHTRVELDGHDVSGGLYGFTFEHNAKPGTFARMTLDLTVTGPIEIEGDVRVVVPDAVADLLKLIGWTPPPGGET
jgi:hypothetical protein